MIVTEYEPEDWKGLRQYVEKSNLVHRSEILGMIDSSLDPDAKEAKLNGLILKNIVFYCRIVILHCVTQIIVLTILFVVLVT